MTTTTTVEAQDQIRNLAGNRLVGWHVEFETRDPFGNREGTVKRVSIVNYNFLSVEFGSYAMGFDFAWETPYYHEDPDGTIEASSGPNIGLGFKFFPPKSGHNRSTGRQRTVRRNSNPAAQRAER